MKQNTNCSACFSFHAVSKSDVHYQLNSSACFSFHAASKSDVLYQLNSLDLTKATQKCDIPMNIIKNNYDIFSEFLFANFNDIILTSLFREQLKYADV